MYVCEVYYCRSRSTGLRGKPNNEKRKKRKRARDVTAVAAVSW